MSFPSEPVCHLYRDDQFYEHRTGAHPESPRRLAAIDKRLELETLDNWKIVAPARKFAESATVQNAIRRMHSDEYLQQLQAFAIHGGGQWDSDTVVSADSYETAVLAASTAVEAATNILEGECRRSFCLTRPPGHHAVRNSAMGFCLLNNIAIAAQFAIDVFNLKRVLIIDWDVHHGNGTQDLFYTCNEVWFFSAHRAPFYPGTGSREERGEQAGEGTTCNLPFGAEVSRDDYLNAVQQELNAFASQCKPELVCISAGFDAHVKDPIGSLGLETEDFKTLTRFAVEIAEKYSKGRVLSILEGGYKPTTLADCVLAHLQEISART